MIYLWLLPVFLAGLIHGRMFGGWLGVRGAIMRLTPALWCIPAWALMPWPMALVVTGAGMLQWDDGHRFNKPWKLLPRYSQYAIILGLVSDFWLGVLIGPISALTAWAFHKWGLPPIHAPWDTDRQTMVDGWEAYWESLTRALSATAWVAAALAYSPPTPGGVTVWGYIWGHLPAILGM